MDGIFSKETTLLMLLLIKCLKAGDLPPAGEAEADERPHVASPGGKHAALLLLLCLVLDLFYENVKSFTILSRDDTRIKV